MPTRLAAPGAVGMDEMDSRAALPAVPRWSRAALTVVAIVFANAGPIALAAPAPASQPSSQPASQPATRPAAVPARHRYTLRQLIDRAREHYPGVEAAQHAVEVMEHKLFQARWAWAPRGTVEGLFAPTPEIRCMDANGQRDTKACVTTNVRNISLNINGVFGRVQLDVGMPLYTFDKLGSVKRAARAGLAAEQARLRAAREDVELNVSKAYWGVKLAREMLEMIHEGRGHLDKARKQIEEQLESGDGDATVVDELRLKTYTGEIESRTLEAQKLERLALTTLATLAGLSPDAMDIDDAVLEAQTAPLLAAERYQNVARQHRPEVAMLVAALAAGQARVALEKARFFPDLLLVGRAGIGYASNIDDPQNSFYNDPFNFRTAAIGLALHWNFDTVEQYGRYREAFAEAQRIAAQRQEALTGIRLEIHKSYLDLRDALDRLDAAYRAQRAARSWLVATSQNIAAGLAESKELTDALVPFFRVRLAYLQAMFDVNVGWANLARKVGLAGAEKVRHLDAAPAGGRR